jgi:hypothetical protein
VVEAQDWIIWAERIDLVLCLLLAAAIVFKRKEAKAAQDAPLT